MKDHVFTGRDVEAALAAAATSLGLPAAELRYVVLDAGTEGRRGLKPTQARIAVLLREEAHRTDAADRGAGAEGSATTAPSAGSDDRRASLRAVVRAVAAAGGLDLACEIEQTEEAVEVRLGGSDGTFFHGDDGRGEPLRAIEHLLQRMHGAGLHPRVLRVRCEGFRERRDAALAEEARRVALAVRVEGRPQTLDPMNAYERRIVHLALQDEPGITTYSVGEGLGRRVTVAPRDPGPGAMSGGADDGR